MEEGLTCTALRGRPVPPREIDLYRLERSTCTASRGRPEPPRGVDLASHCYTCFAELYSIWKRIYKGLLFIFKLWFLVYQINELIFLFQSLPKRCQYLWVIQPTSLPDV